HHHQFEVKCGPWRPPRDPRGASMTSKKRGGRTPGGPGKATGKPKLPKGARAGSKRPEKDRPRLQLVPAAPPAAPADQGQGQGQGEGQGQAAGASPSRIVGIGASAGGLEALEAFLRQVPVKSGRAYVVVQHLDPTHKGMLVELLQRSTPMPVVQAQDAA